MTQRVVNYTYGTGNPVLPDGSIDVRDGIDNLQSMDVFMNAPEDTYNQRDGNVVRTVAGMNNEFDAQILNMGFTRIGTFASGSTLTNPRQTLLWDVADGGDGQEYGWSGSFLPPGKVVPPGSTPLTTGGITVGAWMSRFDPEMRGQVREALRRSYAEAGLTLVDGSFQVGFTLNTTTDVALDEATGKAFSGVVGTYPGGTSTSGFIDRSDSLLRDGGDFNGEVTAPGIISTSHYGGLVAGDNPFGVPGSDWPSPTGLRDAVTVSRKILNEPTDCHAFSDKTVIDTPNDYGGYGSFDATVILKGSHTQDHVASYQARTNYQGNGTLKKLWGMIVWPTASGSSTINGVVGAEIKGVSTTTASVLSNTGVDITPGSSVNLNLGVYVRNGVCLNSPPISFISGQNDTGYSFYAESLGAIFNKGKVFFGGFTSNPIVETGFTKFKLNVREDGSAVTASFSADSSNGAFIAASGNSKISFISNSSILGYWGQTADSNGFIANSSNQPLGTSTKRWNTAYLVTAPNVSSDERLKNFEDVTAAEISCAKQLRASIRKYTLKSGGRVHFGIGAQTLVSIFEAHGLDPLRYNLVSKGEDGFYSVAYEELLCFMMLGV